MEGPIREEYTGRYQLQLSLKASLSSADLQSFDRHLPQIISVSCCFDICREHTLVGRHSGRQRHQLSSDQEPNISAKQVLQTVMKIYGAQQPCNEASEKTLCIYILGRRACDNRMQKFPDLHASLSPIQSHLQRSQSTHLDIPHT